MDVTIEMTVEQWRWVAGLIRADEGKPGVRRGLAHEIEHRVARMVDVRLANHLHLAPAGTVVRIAMGVGDAAVIRSARNEIYPSVQEQTLVTNAPQDAADTIADIARMLEA